MDTQEIEDLKRRLASLELAHKQQRWARITLGILFLSLIVSWYFGKQVFSGRWLAVHDRQGHMTGWWDSNGLELLDANGIERAKLGLSLDGSPYLQMFDSQHRLRHHLFVYTDGSGYLMIWGKDGKGIRYPPSKTPLP